MEVAEDGALCLRRVIGAVPVLPPPKNPGFDKACKLSLKARRLHLEVPCEVAQIPFPRRVHIDGR